MNYRSRLPLNPLQSKSYFPTSTMHSPLKRPTHDLSEVENIIDYERQKFIVGKSNLEGELERERQKRLEFQNKLLQLKAQFTKKENQILQMEYKLNNTLNENEDIRLECTKYKAELERLQELYGQRIQELESELERERLNFDETTNLYNEQFQKFKKEGQDYVDRLTFQYEKKIKTLEDKNKFIENSKREVEGEIKKLKDSYLITKTNYDQQIREMSLKFRDQENKSAAQITKSYQIRLKSVEEAKQQLERKNQDLIRVIQEKEQYLQNNERDKHEQIARLEHEISDLHGKIQHLAFMLDKANNDAYERATSKAKREVVNVDQSVQLKQQLDQRRRQLQDKNAAIRQLKQVLKETTMQAQRKRQDLQQRCNYYEAQSRKYKDEYNKICDTLKSKINQTIASVSTYQRPA